MIWDIARDSVVALLLVLGATMSLAAGVGVMRFSDTLTRLHASTKPQILGLFSLMLAAAIQNASWAVATTTLLVAAFQLLTQPITAHIVGRAAYRQRDENSPQLVIDELADAVENADD
jgi:multicomponent Na+:H+ antiporter subunit G